MKKITFFALLIFLTFPAKAQTGAYEILAAKNASDRKGKPLEKGQFLQEKDRLILGPEGLLILQNKAGNLLEISKEGEYEMNKLPSVALPKSPYADFVAGQLHGDSDRVFRQKEFISKVSRIPVDVNQRTPKLSCFLKEKVFLSWYTIGTQKLKGFRVAVFDMNDNPLKEFTLTDSSARQALIDLDAEGINFRETGPLIFKMAGITEDGSFTEEFSSDIEGRAFMLPEAEEAGLVSKELKVIAPVGSKPSVLQKLITARFFEEKNFISDAAVAYRDALDFSQNLPIVRRLYEDFLYRNILTKEAYKAYYRASIKKR